MVKNLPANAGDAGLIPELEDSLEKNSLEFSPDKSHEPRSLEEYRPLGHKRVGHNLAIKQQ